MLTLDLSEGGGAGVMRIRAALVTKVWLGAEDYSRILAGCGWWSRVVRVMAAARISAPPTPA